VHPDRTQICETRVMALEIIDRECPGLSCRVRIVRRHSARCKDPRTGTRLTEQTDCPGRNASRKCPLMLRGTVNGQRVWWSLDTRTLSVAIERAKEKLAAADRDKAKRLAVPDAIERFLKDKIATNFEGQGVGIEEARSKSDTIRKLTDVLGLLANFAMAGKIEFLDAFNVEHLIAFRNTWQGAYDHTKGVRRPKSLIGKQKYQETLKAFFRFAHNIGWIAVNPASGLAPIRAPRRKRRSPHTPDDIRRILEAVEPTFPKTANKTRAFVLVLCSTGMRLGDVVSLQIDAVNGSKIMLDTGKTDAPVYTRLTPAAVDALSSFPPTSKKYFFWTGNGKLDTAKTHWSAVLLKLYSAAAVSQRSHAFRDTLTTAVLGTGGRTETAAKLLGHRDIKITQDHYEHWDSGRQELLDEALERAWAHTGLIPTGPGADSEGHSQELNALLLEISKQGKGADALDLLKKLARNRARRD